MPTLDRDAVLAALGTVQDPDLHRDLVSLGMIEDLVIDGGTVRFTLVLTTSACPLKAQIEEDCRRAVSALPGVPGSRSNDEPCAQGTRSGGGTQGARGRRRTCSRWAAARAAWARARSPRIWRSRWRRRGRRSGCSTPTSTARTCHGCWACDASPTRGRPDRAARGARHQLHVDGPARRPGGGRGVARTHAARGHQEFLPTWTGRAARLPARRSAARHRGRATLADPADRGRGGAGRHHAEHGRDRGCGQGDRHVRQAAGAGARRRSRT